MRYAKAMIEYAQEKDVEDRVYQEFVHAVVLFQETAGIERGT